MRLEPIASPGLARRLAPPALAMAGTFAIGALLTMSAGGEPLRVFGLIAQGALGSQFAIIETLNRATPLIFTGLAVAVAFRARFWNIGAEAQLYAGAVMTVALGTGWLTLPPALLLPLIAAAAVLGGARCCSARRF